MAPNVINRNFKADISNEKWSTNITEFSILGKNCIYIPPYKMCIMVR